MDKMNKENGKKMMHKTDKNLKVGYQNEYDPMRAMAEQMVKMGSAPDVIYSASAADKIPMRKFKNGGVVQDKNAAKHRKSCDSTRKFAFGGVAKIRHGQSTLDGEPKVTKKVPLSKTVRY